MKIFSKLCQLKQGYKKIVASPILLMLKESKGALGAVVHHQKGAAC